MYTKIKPNLIALMAILITITISFAGCTENSGDIFGRRPNRGPKAILTVSETIVYTYDNITFDASDSGDPDGDSLKYKWDFDGDGTWDESTDDAVILHYYTDDGEYNATLQVVDAHGKTSEKSMVITVRNRAPQASAEVSTYTVKTLIPVNFNIVANDIDGNIVEYRWDFDGDGTWDYTDDKSGETEHAYSHSGTYNAIWSVIDDDGAEVSSSITLIITNRPPEIFYTINTTEALTYSPINFSVAESIDRDGDIVKVDWDFDGNGIWDTQTTALWINYMYENDGIYYPKAKIYDDCGAANTTDMDKIVINNRPPEVNIDVLSTVVKTYKVVNFGINGSDIDGNIVEYKWDFDGDGTWDYSSTTKGETTYEYHDDGYYKVILYVKDDDGAVTEDQIYMNVENRPPEVTLTVSSTEVYTFEDITFSWTAQDIDGNIVSMVWDFDNDGYRDWQSQSATTTKVIYSYEDDGDYTAVFKVKDNDGDVTKKIVNITVLNQAPQITINLAKTTITAGHEVAIPLDATDQDGYIVEFRWDFDGDGTWDDTTTSGYNQHTYTIVGTYTLRVCAIDDDGAVGEDSMTIQVVENQPPVAVAGSDINGYVGVPVTFDATQSYDPDGDSLSYKWDFDGDGTYDWESSTTAITSHTYNSQGTYNAVLLVSDGVASDTDQITVTIIINHAPIAEAGNDMTVDAGDIVTFDGSGSYDPDGDTLTYSWDFGDGQVAYGVTVTHVYRAGGTFTVTLTVTDPGGLSDSDTITVTVNGPTKFAIVIGIADYPGTSSDLYYPDDDAYSWEEYLHSQGYILIGPDDGTGNHRDDPFIDSEATRDAIIDAIRDLRAIEGPDSYIVFAYSGHGIYSYGDSWIVDYTEYGISSSELKNEFSTFDSQHIFFFFDCCESGDFDNDLSSVAEFVAVACGIYEKSLDDPYVQHGGFTYSFLVTGLQTNPSWSVEEAFDQAYEWCSTQYGSASYHPEKWDADTANPFYL